MTTERQKYLGAKTVFWIGAIGDGVIGLEWALLRGSAWSEIVPST